MMTFARRKLIPGAILANALIACSGSPPPRPAPEPATSARPGGSTTTITASEIEKTPGEPIETLLMARSPGVWVGRTADGALAIRIRGSTSFNDNAEPLYIVDGTPFQPASNGGLIGINPYDIASIKVLKDPADLTMYGARGANGVIVIKTKRQNQ